MNEKYVIEWRSKHEHDGVNEKKTPERAQTWPSKVLVLSASTIY